MITSKLIYHAIDFPVILILKLLYDYEQWKRGELINHTREGAIVGVLLLVPTYFLSKALPWHWLPSFLFCWVMICMTFWTLFDGLYNLIRREPWQWTGSVESHDAKLDLLQRRYRWIWKAKIILTIGLIIIYIKSL